MTPAEAELIDRLYAEFYNDMLSYARSVFNNVSQAEEAVQETFRVACANAGDVMDSVNRRGWLFTVLRYTIRNMRRGIMRMNRVIIYADAEILEIQPDKNVWELNVDTLYNDLAGDEDFELFKKIAFEQRSMAEMSEELGISLSAVKQKLHRARKRLISRMNEKDRRHK